MKLCDINPFVRIATRVSYRSVDNQVWVQDCRLFYVLSGSAEMHAGGQSFLMGPGALFYCCKGVCYGLVSEGVELICVNFDLDQSDNANISSYPRNDAREIPPEQNKTIVEEESFLNTYLYIPNGNVYLESLQLLLEEFSARKIYFRESSSGVLKAMLLQMHRQSIASSTAAEKAVLDTIAFIRKHFAKDLTNQMLSEKTGYHAYHLNRLFLRFTGTSIHKYILNTRIQEAKRLLLDTDLPSGRIAERVGFNSNTHFSTYFRQTVGTTPIDYRVQFKNKV